MTCREANDLLGAYVDGELFAEGTASTSAPDGIVKTILAARPKR